LRQSGVEIFKTPAYQRAPRVAIKTRLEQIPAHMRHLCFSLRAEKLCLNGHPSVFINEQNLKINDVDPFKLFIRQLHLLARVRIKKINKSKKAITKKTSQHSYF